MASEHKANAGTKRDALLILLSDKEWHPHYQLVETGGVRYGARLAELRRLGHGIETRGHAKEGKEYRYAGKKKPPEKRVKVLLREEDAIYMAKYHYVPKKARKPLEAALASFRANRDKL